MSQSQEFERLVGLFEQTQITMQIRSVDIAPVVRNWLFGWYIVEFEKSGVSHKEIYGKNLISNISRYLTTKIGKDFSSRSMSVTKIFGGHCLPNHKNSLNCLWEQLYLPFMKELQKQLKDANEGWEAHHDK